MEQTPILSHYIPKEWRAIDIEKRDASIVRFDGLADSIQKAFIESHDMSQDKAEIIAEQEKLAAENEKLGFIRKEHAYKGEATPEECQLIGERHKIVQKQMALLDSREARNRLQRFREVYPFMCADEVEFVVNYAEGNEEVALTQLSQPRFIQSVRKSLAVEAMERQQPESALACLALPAPDVMSIVENVLTAEEEESESEEEMSEEELDEYNAMTPEEQAEARKKRLAERKTGAKKTSKKVKQPIKRARKAILRETVNKNMTPHEALLYRVTMSQRNKVYEKPRLKLNDAMKNVDSQTGWSEARKTAWSQRHKNPNKYLYRFNESGDQANGPWTDDEHKLFVARHKEIGAEGQWGIFSKAIPGRVGYQCANYYRKLLKQGVYKDPNYVRMPDGEFKFVPSQKRKILQRELGEVEAAPKKARSKPVKKEKTKTKAKEKKDEAEEELIEEKVEEKAEEKMEEKEKSVDESSKEAIENSENQPEQPEKGKGGKKKAEDDNEKKVGDEGEKKTEDESNMKAEKTPKRTKKKVDPQVKKETRGRKKKGVEKTATSKKTVPKKIAVVDTVKTPILTMTSGRAGRTRGTADEAPSIDYDPNRHVRRRTLGNDYINPLPDHLDPITLEKVEVPAISPAGVVMGMTSWQQCLEMKDETGKITKKNCPITRKKVSLKDLVVLTPDNIDEYRSKIRD